MTLPHPTRRQLWLALSFPAIGLLIGGSAVWYLSSLRPHIMPEVVEAAGFPIYYPKTVPPHYKLQVPSFHYASKEGVLTFSATDQAADQLVFTEQKQPKKMNFSKFYEDQFTDTKLLSGTPYPSTIGKTQDKKTTILSIITDDAWVIMSTTADISNQDLLTIAQSIAKY